jgi:hypothetical protein
MPTSQYSLISTSASRDLLNPLVSPCRRSEVVQKHRGSQKQISFAKTVFTICTAVAGSVTTTLMTAQVQLPTVNLGDTNFEDGFAGPGFLLEEFPDVYAAGTLKDSKGATVPGSNTLTAISTTSHIAYVSNKRLFGAWIGAEILVPMQMSR